MCSYHRVFLGAALTGILPKPNCMIYTNLVTAGKRQRIIKNSLPCGVRMTR
ncbi:Uncharacterised protein [Dorea longicatena]|nr:Uncharacterised protein [Dorea longicatena]